MNEPEENLEKLYQRFEERLDEIEAEILELKIERTLRATQVSDYVCSMFDDTP